MVNAEGDWVIAEPDQASWDQYQAKAKVSAAAQQAAARGSKELQDKGLECPIDKHIFVEPTKTPCCQTTYCNECITNALLESGLTCPSCSTEDVVLDNLLPDEETAEKVRKYQDAKSPKKETKDSSNSTVTKQESASDKERSNSPEAKAQLSSQDRPANERERQGSSPSKPSSERSDSQSSTPLPGAQAPSSGKKRPAEDELKSDRAPPGPSATAMAKQSTSNSTTSQPNQKAESTPNMPNNQGPFNPANFMMPQMMNTMGFPNMNGFMGMPMNTGMFDPSTMMGSNAFMNPAANWNMWGQVFPQQFIGTSAGFQNGMYATAGYNQNMQMPMANGYNGTNKTGQNGYGKFPNQQRNHFHGANDEDSAYFRRPVNPHRHQARRNANRPTDYREI